MYQKLAEQVDPAGNAHLAPGEEAVDPLDEAPAAPADPRHVEIYRSSFSMESYSLL